MSNFSATQLAEAMEASDAPIATNQTEYHLYWENDALLEFCREEGVTVTAYSPLAEGRVVGDERLAEVGDRYGGSAAQVSIRWLVQQENAVTIPKALTPGHMRANADVFDFELTDAEMRRVSRLDLPFRYRTDREGGYVHRARVSSGLSCRVRFRTESADAETPASDAVRRAPGVEYRTHTNMSVQ